MSFNFLNGVEVGLESPAGLGYNWGYQHAKRLIYLWLKKVVGWSEIDIKGNGAWGSANRWDEPITSPRTDGASDATNPRKFTAAGMTAISDGVVEGDVVMIRPTAAPLTAGGFADPTRNGFYMVSQVVSETELRLHTWFGVHTDGLPLGESGLNFEIHRFHTSALMPIDEDQFVLEGTGVGGTFHMHCRNDHNINYGGGWQWDISPWPDWIAGSTHAWSAAPSRHTTVSNRAGGGSSGAARCNVWGYADLTQVFVVIQGVNTSLQQQDVGALYVGDISPFHAVADPRPVVVMRMDNRSLLNLWNGIQISGSLYQIGADNLTQKTANLCNLVVNQNNTQALLGHQHHTRSWYSGRWVRVPVMVTEEEAGYEELRGQIKGIWRTHYYGPQLFTPVGASLEWLRIGNLLMPWNGSKQFRLVLG